MPTSRDVPYSAQVVSLANVAAEEVQWLWREMIPVGKVTTLIGDAGVGKTFLSLDIAADVTNGEGSGGDDDDGEAGDVLLISPENEMADIMTPRLTQAGADLERVTAMRGVSRKDPKPEDSTRWPFQLINDLRLLELEVGRQKTMNVPLRLIIVDPFPMHDYANRKRAHELVDDLKYLGEIAAWSQTAVLLVVDAPPHVQATPGLRTLETAVHSAWTVVNDFEDPKRRLLLPVKTSYLERKLGRAFRVEDGQVEWEADSISLTVEQYRAEAEERAKTPMFDLEHSELGRARDWLRARLGSEVVPFKTIKAEALANDISERTLRRAFCGLHGIAQQIKGSHAWEWGLRPAAAENS